MPVKINEDDWKKLVGVIQRVDKNRDKIFKEIRLKWGLNLLWVYSKELSEAMGSVTARGGYVRMSFLDVDGKEEWQALRPLTLKKKAERAGLDTAGMDRKEIYDAYSAEFSIWKDTGNTADAVTVFANEGFAGIDSEFSEEEYKKASRTESGQFDYGRKTPRRLFAVANHMFIQAVGKALGTDNSPMSNLLREELIEKVFARYGWGKK